ncbi:MAG: YigZ family protein [Cryomorphaceae bacterium]
MTHPDAYRTVDSVSMGEFRDRGSKFLAFLHPCEHESEIKVIADGLRKEQPGSRHVCHASVLGTINRVERVNDDGEPNGTAGLPILNQLLSAKLTNVALFVVRYFGGTKLGKSGLIYAYKESASQAILAAQMKVKFNRTPMVIRFAYDHTGSVMQAIERISYAEILAQHFDQDCSIEVAIPNAEVDKVLHLFDHTDEVNIKVMDR